MLKPLKPLLSVLMLGFVALATLPASGEISIRVNPDDSVLIKSGYDLDEIAEFADDGPVADAKGISKLTVLFPEESPVVYELESEEDFALLVDGSLPDDADVLMQAVDVGTGTKVGAFEHVITGGDWKIDASFMSQLPKGEVEIRATLRTPGRRDVTVTHSFYILEPGELTPDEDSPYFDWEFDEQVEFPPLIPGEGFMAFEPPADANVYYISETGDDSNPGTTPEKPLRTARAAYERLRDNSSDWMLFKAGETFSGGIGGFTKSGKSPDAPLHIGVYGEGHRPQINTNGATFFTGLGRVDNVRIDGLYVFANQRQPTEHGIAVIGRGKNILVHDVRVDGFSFNMIFQGFSASDIQNVVLYRCIVQNAWTNWHVGHSSGLFASYVNGLQVVECTFDRNGWNPTEQNAVRTMFNHNLYLQHTSENMSVVRTIVTRGSSHGIQMRPGGDVIDSLFVGNAMAFFVAWRPSNVLNNVVLNSDDISRTLIRGDGITILPCDKAVVAGNIVAHKTGSAAWMSGIAAVYDAPGMDKLQGDFNVEIYDNIVWDWWMSAHHEEIFATGAANVTRRNNHVDGSIIESGGRAVYADPTREMTNYIEGGLEEFLRNAVLRPRQTWDEAYSANGFNNWMREGFSSAGDGGPI